MAKAGTTILSLNDVEAHELRKTLERMHAELLRDLAQLAGCGSSSRGIDLCRRRACVQRLIECLDHPPLLQLAPKPLDKGAALKIAA